MLFQSQNSALSLNSDVHFHKKNSSIMNNINVNNNFINNNINNNNNDTSYPSILKQVRMATP